MSANSLHLKSSKEVKGLFNNLSITEQNTLLGELLIEQELQGKVIQQALEEVSLKRIKKPCPICNITAQRFINTESSTVFKCIAAMNLAVFIKQMTTYSLNKKTIIKFIILCILLISCNNKHSTKKFEFQSQPIEIQNVILKMGYLMVEKTARERFKSIKLENINSEHFKFGMTVRNYVLRPNTNLVKFW